MVFAPVFKSCLHFSIQKEQNKVMLFEHVSIVHVGNTDHLFQAVTRPGFALSSRAAPASWLLFTVWAVSIHCSVLAVPEWRQGTLTPPQPSATGWWGAFVREFTACAGISGSLWEK